MGVYRQMSWLGNHKPLQNNRLVPFCARKYYTYTRPQCTYMQKVNTCTYILYILVQSVHTYTTVNVTNQGGQIQPQIGPGQHQKGQIYQDFLRSVLCSFWLTSNSFKIHIFFHISEDSQKWEHYTDDNLIYSTISLLV